MDREAIRELITSLAGVELLSGTETPVAVVPNDRQLIELEKYQDAPARIRQKPDLQSSDSFIDYFNRFSTENSSIFLDMEEGKFAGVLDYHADLETPDWCDHKVFFSPDLSEEWKAWATYHKKAVPQVAFAEHVEEQLDDIIEPNANEVLKAALEFQSVQRLNLESSTNLDDGSMEFKFVKDNVARKIVFPHRIKLKIPVYKNEEPETLEGRIRYRVSPDGALAFIFAFVKSPVIIKLRTIQRISDAIKGGCQTDHVYEGVAWK